MLSLQSWLTPIYERMKMFMLAKSILPVDETTGKVIHRTDGKSDLSHAYNWIYRGSPYQGPTIVLFQSSLSCARTALQSVFCSFCQGVFPVEW